MESSHWNITCAKYHILQWKDVQINISDCYPDLHDVEGVCIFYVLLPCMIELVRSCLVFFLFCLTRTFFFLLFSLIQQVQKFLVDMRHPNDTRNVRSLYNNNLPYFFELYLFPYAICFSLFTRALPLCQPFIHSLIATRGKPIVLCRTLFMYLLDSYLLISK